MHDILKPFLVSLVDSSRVSISSGSFLSLIPTSLNMSWMLCRLTANFFGQHHYEELGCREIYASLIM